MEQWDAHIDRGMPSFKQAMLLMQLSGWLLAGLGLFGVLFGDVRRYYDLEYRLAVLVCYVAHGFACSWLSHYKESKYWASIAVGVTVSACIHYSVAVVCGSVLLWFLGQLDDH